MKKIIIIGLILFLLMPIAIQVTAYSGGDGSSSNPYQITTIEDLWDIRDNEEVNYTLMNDLDFESDASYSNPAHKTTNITGSGWLPYSLQGTLNGNNHTISNLFINRPTMDYVGLFRSAAGTLTGLGRITNLNLLDCNVTGDNQVGGLTGKLENGYASNCHVINATITGLGDISGCFVGTIVGGGINNCSSSGNIIGDTEVGGFIGYADGPIETSYSTANATGTSWVAGFAGYLDGYNISNCYAWGNATGTSIVGGFGGTLEGPVYHCYSVGFVDGPAVAAYVQGFSGASIIPSVECFFDNQTSNRTASFPNNATGKYTSDMQGIKIFSDAGWSIANATDWIGEVWYIPFGGGYPKFPNGEINFEPGIINGSTDICPCCEALCFNITHSLGVPMNVTIYGKEGSSMFTSSATWNNTLDGTYCFCLCGFITPMKYNTTYQWYINATDTVTHLTYTSDTYSFTTAENASDCPCGPDIEEMFEEEDLEESIIKQLEENEMISIIFFIIALGLLILSLIMEAYHTGNADYDNVIMVFMLLSIVMFFVAAAAFVVNETNAYAFMSAAMGFIAIVFLALKAMNLLGSNEE